MDERLLHTDRIWGLIRNSATKSSINLRVKELGTKMLASYIPIGAAAICLKEHGGTKQLDDAVAIPPAKHRTASHSCRI